MSQHSSTPSDAHIDANFRAFHQHLPIASFWKDTELRIRGCNEELLRLLDATDESCVLGKTEQELVEIDTETDHSILEEADSRAVQEIDVLSLSGRQLHLKANRTPLHSPDGEPVGILVTYDDLTRQRHADETVLRQKAALEERTKAIEFDLDSAEQIQKFIMGKQAEPCSFLEVAFHYRYMEKVGGDYLNFRSLCDGTYSILLADLTGHGVTAALFMAMLKYISAEAPEEVRGLPAYFFNYLDMEFCGQIPNGFFTAFSADARYDDAKKSVAIEYASAGHPASIVVRADGSIDILETGDFAIGLLDLVERNAYSVELQLGDRLYAYSDGFLETVSPNGEEFGMERLCQLLASLREVSLKESIVAAHQAIDAWAESDNPQDDMTLVGIEATEPTPEPDAHRECPEDVWGCN